MHHLVRQRREDFGDGAVPEVRRIEGNLIGNGTVGASEPVTNEITVGALATLQGNEGIGKGVFEQRAIQRLVGELQGIVQWVEQLNQVDVSGVEPMTSVRPMRLAMRADAVTDGGIRDKVLANAPEAAGGFFAVPKVVE